MAIFSKLDDVAFAAVLDVPAAGDVDFLKLPAAPGVAVFESREGAGTLLIASTANLRELARRRLEPDLEQTKGGRVDFRALTGRVLGAVVGSGLEADAVYLRAARERLPASYKAVSERWRAWFVHVDPAAEFPQFSKTNLQAGLVAKRSASTLVGGPDAGVPEGVLIGPVSDKDAAGRLIEQIVDAFDLCRFYNVLVQAPKAQACAYKEMGRCPAPCDGSEPMAGYRERTAHALRVLADGSVEQEMAACEQAMKRAAAGAEFEQAAACKARLDRLTLLDAPAMRHLADLRSWRVLWLLPSSVKGTVRPVVFQAGELMRLADHEIGDTPATMKDAARSIVSDVMAVRGIDERWTLSAERVDTIGLVSRWLFKPAKKRAGVPLRLDRGPLDERDIVKALKTIKGVDVSGEVADSEIEG